MEWSKDKTLKLIELLQVNATLWNPSLCDTRRDKQKRKEELRSISDILGVSLHDLTKKVQHLRTQYNRESVREARANAEEPNERYVSNWYAFEFLHFMKDSNKPYRLLQSEDHAELNGGLPTHPSNSLSDCKTEPVHTVKSELVYPTSPRRRDEFSVFGEYIANELRSLKGEKNLLVAKKKIQDVIFEVKMGMICEPRAEATAPIYTHNTNIQGGKIFTTPVMSTSTHIDPLSTTHTPPTSGISEIIINGACHYTNFKVDSQ
ncbi:uncharacterized protein LOC126367498 [Pectinophora gossypiella]|uniref:uncharacterized protein LOC126367498 n=1 Tax=Pectinophora gossypiella TaxID=13191 RepID=UPI00214F0F57|nr:uncharacterized protein LOC126367498 [Pectinophora gossypiella]